jgi:uroporphyrinogen decarboxylase
MYKEDPLSMTSRERVTAALHHEQPDRVPIDLGGSISTSINAMGYQRLKSRIGMADPRPRVSNIVLFVPEIDEALRRLFGIDVIALDRVEAAPGVMRTGSWREMPLPNGEPALFPEDFEPVIGEDGTWKLYHEGTLEGVLSRETGSFVPIHFPLRDATPADIEEYDFPGIEDWELELLRRRARELYENTDYGVFGWLGGSLFEETHYLMGFEEVMVRLAGDRAFMDRLFQRMTDQLLQNTERYLGAVGRYIQVIGFYDDLGIQSGPMIAPELFREHIKPRLREVYGLVHECSDAFVFLHSCGSVYEFMEDFIDIGVDILNPVQTSASGMDPARLKEEFGSRISFWGGGCDVQRVLPLGSPEEVRADARTRIGILGKGGGYVFAPIHNILADVPAENVAAMYEEAYCGRQGRGEQRWR